MRFIRDQGLAITMFGIFAVTLIGLGFAGWGEFNQDRSDQRQPAVSLVEYVGTPALGEAVLRELGERMRQRGSPESKPIAATHSRTGG